MIKKSSHTNSWLYNGEVWCVELIASLLLIETNLYQGAVHCELKGGGRVLPRNAFFLCFATRIRVGFFYIYYTTFWAKHWFKLFFFQRNENLFLSKLNTIFFFFQKNSPPGLTMGGFIEHFIAHCKLRAKYKN